MEQESKITMTELKPCPIPNCRGMANVYNGGNSIWWCECTECEFVGPVKLTKQQAIDAWNKRSPYDNTYKRAD